MGKVWGNPASGLQTRAFDQQRPGSMGQPGASGSAVIRRDQGHCLGPWEGRTDQTAKHSDKSAPDVSQTGQSDPATQDKDTSCRQQACDNSQKHKTKTHALSSCASTSH
jgi:hypothetical protein